MGIKIKNINKGDSVFSFRNGKNIEQIVNKIYSSKDKSGFCITTQSGKQISLSAKHFLWASLPQFEIKSKENILVYLMYRKEFGYRVGITNKGYSKDKLRYNISSRLVQEGGGKLWILDWCSSRPEALLKELTYSLKYGIPTCVFKGAERGLDQNHIDQIFAKFGSQGKKLLDECQLSFEYPHWLSQQNNICFVEHGSKGSQVFFEWTEQLKPTCDLLQKAGISYTKAKGDGRFRIRKWFMKNKEANLFFNKLQNLLKIDASRTLSFNDVRLNLLTASSLLVGMKLPVKKLDKFVMEEIISIEKITDDFVDIKINDASNLYIQDILIHE